jgi:hypothetical protein
MSGVKQLPCFQLASLDQTTDMLPREACPNCIYGKSSCHVEQTTGLRLGIISCNKENEHLSLHTSDDGPHFTHWSPNKPESTWDVRRVFTAKSLGWRNPDRHAHYYANRPLFPESIEEMNGHELACRYVDLTTAKPKEMYEKGRKIELNAPGSEFKLGIRLSTPGQPVEDPSAPHVETEFGDLYFQAKPWTKSH